MMKSACLAFTAMMVLGFAASAETPYARECRLAGGQQWSVSVDTKFDTTLCMFGNAAIGIEELAQYKWGNGQALSIKTFLKAPHRTSNNGLCDIVGAAYITGEDTDHQTWELCRFPDNSVIELNTLADGVSAHDNAGLLRALK